jgi:hypothetical protein
MWQSRKDDWRAMDCSPHEVKRSFLWIRECVAGSPLNARVTLEGIREFFVLLQLAEVNKDVFLLIEEKQELTTGW